MPVKGLFKEEQILEYLQSPLSIREYLDRTSGVQQRYTRFLNLSEYMKAYLLDKQYCTEEYKLKNCQVTSYLKGSIQKDKCISMRGFCDSLMVLSLMAVVLSQVNGKRLSEMKDYSFEWVFSLGIDVMLPPTRQIGFRHIVETVRVFIKTRLEKE